MSENPERFDSRSEGGTPTYGPNEGVPRLKGYRVAACLGEGGMGIVYRAVQESTGREVALKVLKANVFQGGQGRKRFEREIRLAARLEHPYIARVYDAGTENGVSYYSMQLIKGEHLDRYVRRRALPEREILELMTKVAQAMDFAHQQSMVHRDLKPSNVLVTEDGTPYLLDFGLVKLITKEEPALDLSLDGTITGTPGFMAPEQAAGHLAQIDARTDIYAFGCLLYHLLTGEFPHDLSGTQYEVLRRIAEEEIRNPRQFAPDMDPRLEHILCRCLARDPKNRYSTFRDVLADVDAYLGRETVMLAPPKRARRLPRRDVVAASISALLVVAWIVFRLRGGPWPAPISPRVAAPPPAAAVAFEATGPSPDLVEIPQPDPAAEAEQARAGATLARPVEVKTRKTGIVLRLVPAGRFVMGSAEGEAGREPDEAQREVTITKPFYAGKVEVTRAQWEAVMGAEGPPAGEAPNAPAGDVSWDEVQGFLASLCETEGVPEGTYRLPTEAEWEYACRTGEGEPVRGANEGTREEGAPNAWGLYDMLGSVWEWCADWYAPDLPGPATDPVGPPDGAFRVNRGGSWKTGPQAWRAANRRGSAPDGAWADVGFRVVRSVP